LSGGLTGSCHCGAVRITLADSPAEVTVCNCTLCRKTGARWVYAAPGDVTFSDAPLEAYVRADLTEPSLETRRCAACGIIVAWRAFDADYPRMGINANLLDASFIDALPVRRVDGSSWPL
jgi:hypothetical protein